MDHGEAYQLGNVAILEQRVEQPAEASMPKLLKQWARQREGQQAFFEEKIAQLKANGLFEGRKDRWIYAITPKESAWALSTGTSMYSYAFVDSPEEFWLRKWRAVKQYAASNALVTLLQLATKEKIEIPMKNGKIVHLRPPEQNDVVDPNSKTAVLPCVSYVIA